MTKTDFLSLMNFPKEWEEYGMYPDELAQLQIGEYKPGHEDASEHDRCGAFHWWLKRDPNEDELIKLMKLAHIDPESYLGYDIRDYIRKARNYSESVERAWGF